MSAEIKNLKETPSKEYELSFLLNSAEALNLVSEILKRHGSQMIYEGPANQTRLAYPIKKQNSAFFGFSQFSVAPEEVKKIKAELELSPSVLRFLIITPPVKAMNRERRREQWIPEVKPKQPASALSNEALEQKIEEILK